MLVERDAFGRVITQN